MTIDEIFDRILLRSGQYILRKARIEIDVDSFRILVEDALSEYSGFVPHTCEYTMNFNSSRSFTFPPDFDTTLNRSPDWLSEVTPISSFGSVSTVFRQRDCSELIDPIQAPWDYNKKTKVLTVPYSSYYKVIGVYEHEVSKVDGSTNSYEVLTIDKGAQPFFKILQGMFLQGIGRSRRAFTLSDLPILMDADTLVSEGVEIVEKANEEMQDDQKFYLAYD